MLLLSILLTLATYLFLAMSQNQENPQGQEDILVTIGNKQVPLSKINKPHNVVVGGVDKPVPNLQQFPDVEPEAKAREAKLDAERAARKKEEL
ncbi:CIC11C00000003697 [Sungouiella intermedia]|uniref:CIC11C00000003697 n=1 Tax=Sungouiella intermedia TaxID=45354 RepID=A0A1L0DFS0_9ASCO|nr:CIC11C00000003697 [[Candida] intermedia]